MKVFIALFVLDFLSILKVTDLTRECVTKADYLRYRKIYKYLRNFGIVLGIIIIILALLKWVN